MRHNLKQLTHSVCCLVYIFIGDELGVNGNIQQWNARKKSADTPGKCVNIGIFTKCVILYNNKSRNIVIYKSS